MKTDQTGQLISLMLATGRAIREASRGIGLSPFSALRVEALAYVDASGHPTMRDMAEHFSITPPSATSLVHGLVKSGAVRRVADAGDRRVTRLAITASGRRALETGRGELAGHMRAVLDKLDASERDALIKIFTKLSRTYPS